MCALHLVVLEGRNLDWTKVEYIWIELSKLRLQFVACSPPTRPDLCLRARVPEFEIESVHII
jgi:hypothetical protein